MTNSLPVIKSKLNGRFRTRIGLVTTVLGFIIFLVGAEVMLALLYAVLVLVVRRARNVIEAQQQTIQERTTELETLSRRLMKSEEVQKKKKAGFLFRLFVRNVEN